MDDDRMAHHASGAPDVSGGAIACPNQDLDRAVLPCLDVLSKVFMLEERRGI